jgi:hypothetical protein
MIDDHFWFIYFIVAYTGRSSSRWSLLDHRLQQQHAYGDYLHFDFLSPLLALVLVGLRRWRRPLSSGCSTWLLKTRKSK